MNDKSAFLEISTWVGIDIDASHYNGHLIFIKDGKRTRVAMEKVLTEEDCLFLNKKYKGDKFYCEYKPGDERSEFFSQKSLEEFTRDFVLKNNLKFEVIFWGSSQYCAPEGLVTAPQSLMDKANTIYRRIKDLELLNDEKRDKERLSLYRNVSSMLKEWE